MKQLSFLFAMLLAISFGCGAPTDTTSNFQNADVETFKKLMSQSDMVLLDVRTPGEYEEGHIEGATLIDVEAPDFEQKIKELEKDKTYLVYCRSGQRSVTACNIMQEQGFANLVNLVGGYQAWSQK